MIRFTQESVRALKLSVFRHFTGPLNDNAAYVPGSGQSELYTSDKVMWIKNVKASQLDVQKRMKDNGLHKILPLYDNDRRVAALSGTHASAHERALAFDASKAKAKTVPDEASSSSESSEYEFDPPDDADVKNDAPAGKEVGFPKAAPEPVVAK